MKVVILLLLAVFSILNAKSCYTVALISLPSSQNNDALLDSYVNYDESCRKMKIGDFLTVRCACFYDYKEIQRLLPAYKKKYKEAYITSTYESRFQKQEVLTIPNVEEHEIEIVKVSLKDKKNDLNITKLEKVKKKKKVKYVKKRENKLFYDKYLHNFTGQYMSSALAGKYGTASLDFKYRFGAQLSYDIGYVNEKPAISEQSQSYFEHEWRRVRVFHKGSFFDEKLFYELEYSFTGDNNYKDIFIGYQGKSKALDTRYRLKMGNIKIPFSLETYTSSKYITFMERALTDSFADNRKLGTEFILSKKVKDSRVNLFGAAFTDSLNDRDEEIKKYGYSSRLTYAQKMDKSHLFSFGGAVKYIDMNGDSLKYNQGSESNLMRDKYVSVKIKDVNKVLQTNLEFLYINDAYSLQGEYVNTAVDALKDNYNFKAYYMQGSYFIFGTGRRYKLSTSTLSKIIPNTDTSLEFAIRYSYIDLNDKDEIGGTQSDINYALNWYVTRELKCMLNYVVSQPKGTDDYDGLLSIVQARVLFAF